MPNNAPTKKVIPTIKRGSGLSELDLLMTGRSKANRRGAGLGPTDATILAVDEIEARLHRRTLLAPLEQKISGLEELREQLQQDIEFQKSKLSDSSSNSSSSSSPGPVSLSPDLDPAPTPTLQGNGSANLVDPPKGSIAPTVEFPSQLPLSPGDHESGSLNLVPRESESGHGVGIEPLSNEENSALTIISTLLDSSSEGESEGEPVRDESTLTYEVENAPLTPPAPAPAPAPLPRLLLL